MKSSKKKFNELFRKIHQQMLKQKGLLEQSFQVQSKQQQQYEKNRETPKIIDPFLKKIEKSYRRADSATKQLKKGLKISIASPSHRKTKTIADEQMQTLFQTFSKYIFYYMHKLGDQQRKVVKVEIDKILLLVKNCKDFSTIGNKLKSFQQKASKQLSNRLSQLVFCIVQSRYERHSQKFSLDKKIEKLIICEYYCRKMSFDQLTVKICLEIYRSYIEIRNFKQSRIYAKKALKLAVILNDRDLEFKIVEQISLINFYEGKLNKRSHDFLEEQQRLHILKNYNEENEMPPIFIPEHKRIELLKKQSQEFFEFQRQNNFVSNQIPKTNKQFFAQHFNAIGRKSEFNRYRLLKTMGKVADVGSINKHIGQKRFITLMPESHQIPQTNQLQIHITHTKRSIETNSLKFINEELPLLIKCIQNAVLSWDTFCTTFEAYESLASNVETFNAYNSNCFPVSQGTKGDKKWFDSKLSIKNRQICITNS